MGGSVGEKMNPRIRLTSAKFEVGVEVEAELGNTTVYGRVAKNTLRLEFLNVS